MTGAIAPRVRMPATARPGEVVRVRTLLTHPMETGRRRGTDGALVPRWIVTRFRATFENAAVIDIAVEPAVAANPFFEFELRVPGPGEVVLVWEDDAGGRWSHVQWLGAA